MKMTLLELTQEILSSMESDEVYSINDTVESYQVALLLRGVYYYLATDIGLLEHESIFNLDASGDATKPVLMTVPNNVTRIDWVKYDKQDPAVDNGVVYLNTNFKPFDEFIEMQNGLQNVTADVSSMTQAGDTGTAFTFWYHTDRHPTWYTSFDNHTLIFDAYDSAIEITLQSSKTMCYGQVWPTFDLLDDFIPDLDITQFALFRNRAKVRAFAELKQAANQEAAGEARRQKIISQKRNRVVPDIPEVLKVARYGRK